MESDAAMTDGGSVESEALRILVVEDSPIVGERLLTLLRTMPRALELTHAENMRMAEDFFTKTKPDAVVLDISLPDGSGFDLLRLFKDRRPECMVIILTSYAFPEFRQNSEKLGADYFFGKGLEIGKVVEVLRGFNPPRTRKVDR